VLSNIVFSNVLSPIGVPGQNRLRRNAIVFRKMLEFVVVLVTIWFCRRTEFELQTF
jgi:hypothetical protein